MTSPLLQEAAKVRQDAYSEWMTQHGYAIPWEEYLTAALLRWLLTREPTEAMVHAGEDVPIPRMFGQVYRAMNAALLKEVG